MERSLAEIFRIVFGYFEPMDDAGQRVEGSLESLCDNLWRKAALCLTGWFRQNPVQAL
jgi:hypothetical protein